MYSSLKKTYSTIDYIKPLEKTYSTIKLEITTGKKMFSGTDDDIYLILWNTLPWSPLETLLHSDYKDTFENGQIDTFIVNPVTLLLTIQMTGIFLGFVYGLAPIQHIHLLEITILTYCWTKKHTVGWPQSNTY